MEGQTLSYYFKKDRYITPKGEFRTEIITVAESDTFYKSSPIIVYDEKRTHWMGTCRHD